MSTSTPRNTLEIEVSNFDGKQFTCTLRWLLAEGWLTAPHPSVEKSDMFSEEAQNSAELKSKLRAISANVLVATLGLGHGDRPKHWATITDIRIHIHASARALRAIPWELLSTLDEKERRVYRFVGSDRGGGSYAHLPPPSRMVLALQTLSGQGHAPKFENEHWESLTYDEATLDRLIGTLEATTGRSESAAGDTEAAQDALLVLRTAITSEEEYLFRLPASSTDDTPRESPDAVPLSILAGKLGQLADKAPRLLVWVNDPDNRRLSVESAAHDLVEAGVSAVVLLPKLPLSRAKPDGNSESPDKGAKPALDEFLERLWENVSSPSLETDELLACVWNALPDSLKLPGFIPVIVGSSRSGVFWHQARAPVNMDEIKTAFPTGASKKKKTVISGPLAAGSLYHWLRAPVDALGLRTGSPFHPRDRSRPDLLSSYLLASGGQRNFLEIQWYLCWAAALAKWMPPIAESAQVDPAGKVLQALQAQKSPSFFLDPNKAYDGSAENPIGNADGRIDAYDPRALMLHMSSSKSPSFQSIETLRDSSEAILKSVLTLFRPGSALGSLLPDKLKTSAYGRLAALNADLYITLDPLPLLEYALAQAGKKVRYLIWPCFGGGGRWWNSPLTPVETGDQVVHLIYLAGAVHDPATVLFTEQEILAKLPPEPGLWTNLVLQEVGGKLGMSSIALFLGFEPQDPLFQQLLAALFPSATSRATEQLVVALRPKEDAFTYPAQAQHYLEELLRNHFHKIYTRLDRLDLPGLPKKEGEDLTQPIKLYWGSPLQLIGELLESAPDGT